VRLRSLTGETFEFDPGTGCLELAHTGGEGFRAAYESLHRPADLDRWLRGHLGAGRRVEAADEADLDATIGLRNAFWRCVDARLAGNALPVADTREISRHAAHPPPVPAIDERGYRTLVSPVTVRQVLAELARDAIELLTGPRLARLRQCEAGNCHLVFVDSSRPGRRRWCSMQRCGNRAKVAAFRHRNREDPSS
jgi:predicted RNA-binding Zn ribbon-like protein